MARRQRYERERCAKGPTWAAVGAAREARSNSIETRELTGYTSSYSETGRSRVKLRCPFCKGDVWAYLWSYAAHGKRCTCGALIGRNSAHHFADRKD